MTDKPLRWDQRITAEVNAGRFAFADDPENLKSHLVSRMLALALEYDAASALKFARGSYSGGRVIAMWFNRFHAETLGFGLHCSVLISVNDDCRYTITAVAWRDGSQFPWTERRTP